MRRVRQVFADAPTVSIAMSDAVQQILNAFDCLSEGDKHQTIIEIHRRLDNPEGNLPESVFVETADELFRILDDEELAWHKKR